MSVLVRAALVLGDEIGADGTHRSVLEPELQVPSHGHDGVDGDTTGGDVVLTGNLYRVVEAVDGTGDEFHAMNLSDYLESRLERIEAAIAELTRAHRRNQIEVFVFSVATSTAVGGFGWFLSGYFLDLLGLPWAIPCFVVCLVSAWVLVGKLAALRARWGYEEQDKIMERML